MSVGRGAVDACGTSREGALATGVSPRGGAFKAPTVTAAATTTKPMAAAQIFDVASKTLYLFSAGESRPVPIVIFSHLSRVTKALPRSLRCRFREKVAMSGRDETVPRPHEKPSGGLRAVCVYCGSSAGHDPRFLAAAEELGRRLAEAGIALVYGGGGRGLMGATARAVLAAGGRVTGVIPDFLTDNDAVLRDAQDLVVVPDMHTRKRLMFERADAFVALPGGIGTLEELVEQLTWVQLAQHAKPVLIADVGGFWQPLLDLLQHMREQGFIPASLEVPTLVAKRIEDVLPMLQAGSATPSEKPLDGRL